MKQTLAVTRKELAGYFGSPMALIFVGVFLAVTLFSFFWLDTFFARGIADVRPLFQRLPVLLILLVAALTMRQWSEEQRSGTLEMLLTMPVRHASLVIAKFLAVMALVAVALTLTLFLPLTASFLGNLDWGPVIGGYLAALLLAATYAAVGLWISARTDNQIVALILTIVVCGVLYLIGSDGLTGFLGERMSTILRAIGSGSRFESVERGVIDLRDLIYYLSLTALFLALNVAALDRKGWSRGERTRRYRTTSNWATALLSINLILVNVWVYPLHGLRLDLTAQKQYTLSPATRQILQNLQEPLLVRGYFSEETHPLLAPLVPTLRDLLEEYRIASNGMMQVEIIDPATDPDKEAEANQTYGIQATPFQVTGRRETSIINSYFDILVRYGDQSTVLNFQDLIQVDSLRDGTVQVSLRNPEYDLTSAIKKTVYGFQNTSTILAGLQSPAQLTAYVTMDTLPDSLSEVPVAMEKVAQDLAGDSGKLQYSLVDPDAAGSSVTRQDLADQYGLQPFAASLFSTDTYYLYMVLQLDDQTQVIYPSGSMSESDIRTSVESAVRRAAPGVLNTVGLWVPPSVATQDMFGQTQQPLSSWQMVSSALSQDYHVTHVDLSSGQVPADIDVLVLVLPQGLSDSERFAVDQYLMRGGAVVAAAGNYGIDTDPYTGGLLLRPITDGIGSLLSAYGLTVEPELVMDPQNESFPVPVTRQVGTTTVQEIRAVPYPYFVDVRSAGMAADSAVVSGLSAVTLQWASPIAIDATANISREVTSLIRSSADSWVSAAAVAQPDYDTYPDLGFPTGDTTQAETLAVAVRGSFASAFRGQEPPAATTDSGANADTANAANAASNVVIDASPDTSRLVVIGSGEFLDDTILNLSASMNGDRYLNNLQLLKNAVDWCSEDLDLLDIRARGSNTHLLASLSEGQQSFWEGANYALALLALAALGVYWSLRRRNEKPLELPAVVPNGDAGRSDSRRGDGPHERSPRPKEHQ